MKRYLYIVVLLVAFIINGCKKEKPAPAVVVVPSISIQTINFPAFVNSTWNTVAGGTLNFDYDVLGTNSETLSSFKDSTNYDNLKSYSKALSIGVYNISVSSKDQTNPADTFLQFNAKVRNLAFNGTQALALAATTSDGLITIGQSFVQDNTVPSFKPDGGTTSYQFGLISGFYYLYVKGGTKGVVTFKAQVGTQNATVTKIVNVVALNQYNMEAVPSNKGTFDVVFAPFSYNQVLVSSSTLLTVNASPGVYSAYKSVFFVVTDENGTVLNSVPYVPGTTSFKISARQPYEKTRFNFFEIEVPQNSASKPTITGYLQVKKGSTYSNPSSLPYKPTSPVTLHLKNSPGFTQLNVSTNFYASQLQSLADSLSLYTISYATGSKVWVQMLKNNQYSYNFFTVTPGNNNFNVDLSKLTETPLMQNITAPGTNLQVSVYGKTNSSYTNAYYMGMISSATNQVNYPYPTEPFVEYDVLSHYSIGAFSYNTVTAGASIPSQITPFSASFNVQSSTLASFVPSYTGTFDYYEAVFTNTLNIGPDAQFILYSPSAAGYTNIKLPDFSGYLGLTSWDLSTQVLRYFSLSQVNGFNEAHFTYPTGNNVSSSTVYSNY